MKLVYAVVVGVVMGSPSYLWAQTLGEREMRERVTVLDEKMTKIDDRVGNLDQRMDKIEGMISASMHSSKSLWVCEGRCSFRHMVDDKLYYVEFNRAVYGQGENSIAAINNMRDECQKLKLGKDSPTVGSIGAGDLSSAIATIQNSCHQE